MRKFRLLDRLLRRQRSTQCPQCEYLADGEICEVCGEDRIRETRDHLPLRRF